MDTLYDETSVEPQGGQGVAIKTNGEQAADARGVVALSSGAGLGQGVRCLGWHQAQRKLCVHDHDRWHRHHVLREVQAPAEQLDARPLLLRSLGHRDGCQQRVDTHADRHSLASAQEQHEHRHDEQLLAEGRSERVRRRRHVRVLSVRVLDQHPDPAVLGPDADPERHHDGRHLRPGRDLQRPVQGGPTSAWSSTRSRTRRRTSRTTRT